jgi:uncharacterized protein YjiS (DUF1127 family)
MLIRQWQPWTKSTGPRTPEGLAKSARNAEKGGHWRVLREAVKELNRLLREQKEGLALVRPR